MTDLLPIWIKEAIKHNRLLRDRAQKAYSKLNNKNSVYAKSLLIAANAYNDCIEVWGNVAEGGFSEVTVERRGVMIR